MVNCRYLEKIYCIKLIKQTLQKLVKRFTIVMKADAQVLPCVRDKLYPTIYLPIIVNFRCLDMSHSL